MRPHLFGVLLLAAPVFFFNGNGAAPQQPDLSGTWIATKDTPKDVAAAPSPVLGARFAIKQDAGSVVLSRVSRDGTFATTFPLSGADVRWRVPGQTCQADSERVEKMTVEGDGLALNLVSMLGPGATEPRAFNIKYLLRPDSADTLVVQGTMVRQGEAKPVATVYRRSAEPMPAPAPVAASPVKGVAARIAQAAWIGTTWIGEANTMTVEERWTPPASGAMLGIGRTLRGPQLASFEFLCIVEREGSLAYLAMPSARTPATIFTLTNITADTATFENPAHDYPKLIRYTRLADGSLQTTISGGEGTKEETVVLKRQ